MTAHPAAPWSISLFRASKNGFMDKTARATAVYLLVDLSRLFY